MKHEIIVHTYPAKLTLIPGIAEMGDGVMAAEVRIKSETDDKVTEMMAIVTPNHQEAMIAAVEVAMNQLREHFKKEAKQGE